MWDAWISRRSIKAYENSSLIRFDPLRASHAHHPIILREKDKKKKEEEKQEQMAKNWQNVGLI